MTNPLSTIDAPKWIGDGTEGATLAVDGSTVTVGSARRGTPYNVRLDCDDASPPSSLFYEVELGAATAGSVAVGLVAAADFRPGWQTRGMFYNGNLTNGSAGLRIGFGDRPKAGDRVGVCLRRDDGDDATCRVAYYLNGRCLGVGFAVASTAAFCPCLHVDGAATVTYAAPSAFPSTAERQPASFGDPYSGGWRLSQAFTGPELHELPMPEGAEVVLNFALAEQDTYRLSIKVANTFHCTVRVTGKMENFDKIEVGPVMATRMMPPPELRPLETFAESASTFFKMIVLSDAGGNLVMSGPAAEILCERHDEAHEGSPLTTYS